MSFSDRRPLVQTTCMSLEISSNLLKFPANAKKTVLIRDAEKESEFGYVYSVSGPGNTVP